MLIILLTGFLLASAAPWLYRMGGRWTGWLLALYPLGVSLHFVGFVGPLAAGETVAAETYAWAPSLDLSLTLALDGLSLLFGLLIAGIGALVLIYAGGYMAMSRDLGAFYGYLLAFMASMLGVALAGNLIALYVFWELTTLTSFLLIGYNHENEASRAAAWQALLTTAFGGLALLAGILLLGQAGGTFEIAALARNSDAIKDHPFYGAILALVLVGAFAKSAQFPFHSWLPAAMQAPTPVSAYLHSATMVKAGVYLLARLFPVLGGTAPWMWAVTVVGAITMLMGAYLSIRERDLKLILAYSTVSVLGLLTMLLGIGTELALKAAVVYLAAHALYKGGLFLVAGAIDHETGTRDVGQLAGLGRRMPIVAAASLLAAVSMSGVLPFLGFLAKELFYEATWEAEAGGLILTAVAAAASVLLIVAAGLVGLKPFLGRPSEAAQRAHEAPFSLWLGPVVLGVMGLVGGLFPQMYAEPLLAPAASAAAGVPVTIGLQLWHGWSGILVFSLITLAGGVGLFVWHARLLEMLPMPAAVERYGPAQWYNRLFDGMMATAQWQTRMLQSGYLRYYLLISITTTVGLVVLALALGPMPIQRLELTGMRADEAALAILILFATGIAVNSESRFRAIAALGVVGYGIAVIFVIYGAPDLAMTQFVTETLIVILFVLTFYHLPRFVELSSRKERIRDGVVALAAGGLMAALLLYALEARYHPPISDYFIARSVPDGHGRNVVNVILVDFRSIDTLGEITVLAVAAVGVYVLLKLTVARTRVD